MCKNNKKQTLQEQEYNKQEEKFQASDFHKNVNFSYAYVMRAYSQYCKDKVENIAKYRKIFFRIILIVFVLFALLSIAFLIWAMIKTDTQKIISAVITFLANILVFPVIIAKYLFNHDEDKEFLHLYKEYFADFSKNEIERLKVEQNANAEEKNNYGLKSENANNVENINNMADKLKNIENNK